MGSLLDELKWKAQLAKWKAEDLARDARRELERIETDVRINHPEAVARAEQAIGRIGDAIETTVTQTAQTIATLISEPHTMEHKVIMLGGRRAGKSTILASILHLLKEGTPGYLAIADVTDYNQKLLGTDGKMYRIPTLQNKRAEAEGFILEKKKGTSFLVDMAPSKVSASYVLNVKENRGNNTIKLEFVDVPGEWMRQGTAENAKLEEIVHDSDVFVIAIDTPFLMQDGEEQYSSLLNETYNRIPEIESTLVKNMKIEETTLDTKDGEQSFKLDRKLILLCPVKCEKWVQEHRIGEVTQKVKKAYKNLIKQFVTIPEVEMWIMPISTVGGLQVDQLRPAMRFYKDEDDKLGITCHEDPLTGVIINGEGKVIRRTPASFVEPDEMWKIDHVRFPLAWYKLNGRGFKPEFCEQPGYHILKFLIGKEENFIETEARVEREKLDDMGPIRRWLKILFHPTFGQYLPIWKQAIQGLQSDGLIKTNGDGFERVTHPIS